MTVRYPFIVGQEVYLRGFERADLRGNFFQWANDPEVTRYMYMGAFPNVLERLEDEYERWVKSNSDIVFAICDKKDDAHIGNVSLNGIIWPSRVAEFRIIIGEKDFWNRGIGTEAAQLVVEYGFMRLNLNRIWLGVNAAHKGAIRSYEKAGFRHEGLLRQDQYRDGEYYDVVRMGILREEWLAERGASTGAERGRASAQDAERSVQDWGGGTS